MGNLEEQQEEIEVLRSIYGEEVLIVNEKSHHGKFLVHPVLPQPIIVFLHPKGGVKKEIEVSYLPPIVLHFHLPPGYPSTRSPAFVLSCLWLTRAQLSALCRQLDVLWHECKPEVVLFRWVQFLQEDALLHLSIHSQLDITPLVTSVAQGNACNLVQALRNMSSIPSEEDNKPQENANSNSTKTTKVKAPRDLITQHLGKTNIDREREAPEKQLPKQRGRGRRTKDTVSKSGPHQLHEEHRYEKGMPSDKVLSDVEVLKNLKISANLSCQEVNTSEDPRAVVDLKTGVPPLPIIVEYNEQKQNEAFNKQWFSCKVCLSQNVGKQCLQFVGCHHVFCKSCMQIYFEVRIKEGNVQLLTCPEEKCSSQATPAQVYDLVGMELYDRYDRMLLESSLATMGDLTYCPRKSCQFMVIKDHSENYATCERCLFVFCHFCRKTYHGVAPCSLRIEEKFQIIKEYQSGSATDKLHLEKRYGKKQLLTMIEEAMSEKWVSDCTKKCPRCSASIQKIDGCNKMLCWRCNTFFCWLCMTKLDPATPYVHFNEAKSKCFNLLFEGTHDVEDDEDWEFGQFV